ncbi:GNAT family N-acetyltransferase [Mangrovimonas aestuarii]|uniref:GNAT family N-acetyltransferase n=1 Tax=Mangrovimonas aestuarii TaxID=3018443 RepID=UPI0023799312|nr:GNAT family N-acetyltransferase [Mangrovimonas aestuarii]
MAYNSSHISSITYSSTEGHPDEETLKAMIALSNIIFETNHTSPFIKRLSDKQDVFSVLAYEGNTPIGFKIGYRINQKTFYSWMGGILEAYRRKGIAKQLALHQEEWVKSRGYSVLRTKSMNRFKPMMIFNLKNGFDIVDSVTDDDGFKVIFEKRLD